VDAVIFVFSLENETSFNAIYNYYAKMSKYRNMQDIPIILVGTQGADVLPEPHCSVCSKSDFFADFISENHPRLIDEARARKLAIDLKKCSYYETCATYGLNVERVFQDGEERYPVLDLKRSWHIFCFSLLQDHSKPPLFTSCHSYPEPKSNLPDGEAIFQQLSTVSVYKFARHCALLSRRVLKPAGG
jgi:hypothetical protein